MSAIRPIDCKTLLLDCPSSPEDMEMPDRIPLFPHRHNHDGSYDSICRHCFATVGTRKTEEELIAIEAKHVCDRTILYQNGSENTERE
jgi:hypothetical protein